MSSKEDKKELIDDFDSLRKSVSELRQRLNILNEQKESCFKKKETISDEIIKSIVQLKEEKKQRDSFTSLVKGHKAERQKIQDSVQKLASDVKVHTDERDKIQSKNKIDVDPHKIKGQIDMLESKIETEAMPFKKEKELMQIIKDLKKKYRGAKDIIGVTADLRKSSKILSKSKTEAHILHRKVQKDAQSSQRKHEALIKTSKHIDELRKEEKKAFSEFVKFKKQYVDINKQLKDKLDQLHRLQGKADAAKKASQKKHKESNLKIQRLKADEVEEKFKKGGKITTEDLLYFQEKK